MHLSMGRRQPLCCDAMGSRVWAGRPVLGCLGRAGPSWPGSPSETPAPGRVQVSNNHVSRLESSVSSYQGTVQHLEGRIRQLEDERDALLHSNAALRHRLDRLEAADERSARSLSFGAAGEAHDDIAQMVRRLGGGEGPLPEDDDEDDDEGAATEGGRGGCL